MPVQASPVRTLIKGLVTERQELAFPEDASVDELNMTIDGDGKRSRRKGLVLEDSFQLSSFVVGDTQEIYEQTWFNVGGVANLEFLVIQIGATLYFYSKSSVPFSSGEQSFTVNLNDFNANNGESIENNSIQGDSLDGVFVVVHKALEPFYIEYDVDTTSITTTQIIPKVRDFAWQGTTSDYFKPSTSSSDDPIREYDSLNAGLFITQAGYDPLDAYRGNRGNSYPPLTHPWYSSQDASGNWNIIGWERLITGTSLTANGHFILNFFNKDRESEVAGLGVEVENSRFTTVAAYANRFWYAGLESSVNSGSILFSKNIESPSDYGTCYQENDPTSEEISDLLDTDGGVIRIPEAYGIRKLFVVGTNLMVFADNGIWLINGVDNVFRPTEFSVSKISNSGLIGVNSFVNADGVPFWWSKTGIQTVSENAVSANPVIRDITEDTIQSFWDAIETEQKIRTKGIYDEVSQKIFWIYADNSETVLNKFNNLLVLDVRFGAFYPWKISDQTNNTNTLVGLSFFSSLGVSETTSTVTVSGSTVTVNGTNVSVSEFVNVGVDDTEIKFLVKDGDSNKLTFATVSSSEFLDWGDTDYSSFIETGYSFLENLSVYKSPISLVTYFKVTETGFSDNGDGSYSLVNPSSCLLKSYWEFNRNSNSQQQVYRLKRIPVVDENNLNSFPYGEEILVNRTRIKGRGRSVNLRFESEQGKDFVLLGYEIIGNFNDGL